MHWVNINVAAGTATGGVYAAGTAVVMRAPQDKYGGGVTILDVVHKVPTGTLQLVLNDAGAAATAVGSIIEVGTVFTNAFGTVNPSGYWLDGGNYLTLRYPAAGTLAAGPAHISVGYKMGR